MITFENANGYTDSKMPVRSSLGSSGYDFYSLEDIVVKSYPEAIKNPKSRKELAVKPTLVHTGVTAEFDNKVTLMIFDRSSNPIKRGLSLTNGVGIIDSDYYNSDNNEILGMFYNFGNDDYTIHKGDRIMQGVFVPNLLTNEDNVANASRNGGFGSSGK